jgi:magnesium-transporting ATPase (P-type)
MTVKELWFDGNTYDATGVGYNPAGGYLLNERELDANELRSLEILVKIASFCNNARLLPPGDDVDKWTILGDPTEGALLTTARKAGFDYDDELSRSKRVYALPFDSVRKMMSTIHIEKNNKVAYVKGAPKEVLGLCDSIWRAGDIKQLDDKQRIAIMEKNDEFARNGLRVLAMAYRNIAREEKNYTAETVEKNLIFAGLIAMMDPPREEVATAVEACATAGIKIVMVTGDYGLTAESIARRIGIVKGDNVRIITGAELDEMSIEALEKELGKPDILFARVSPEHKMKIAKALKEMGHVVAMTGDGVNDAPALKMADIGVAMGITGTDVAKEAAEMILTDDNFASIVNAIEEGRAV